MIMKDRPTQIPSLDSQAVDILDQQEWLDPIADGIQHRVRHLYGRSGAARQVQRALQGEWLGHPIHSALGGIPMGAWTASLAMDIGEVVCGQGQLAPGADAALELGLATAAAAAVTGWADWSEMDGTQRRVGLVHGLVNGAAVALYAASALARRTDHRDVGQICAVAGWLLASAGGWLGGAAAFHGVDAEQR